MATAKAAAASTSRKRTATPKTKAPSKTKTAAKAAPRKRAVKKPAPEALSFSEQVERLAYQYWEERGRPDGSAHEDWLRAEAELAAGRR